MSTLPRFALRPLAFPSHRVAALVSLASGRVVAFVPAALRAVDGPTRPTSPTIYPSSAADAAASGDTCALGAPLSSQQIPSRYVTALPQPSHVSAGGNARRVASVECVTLSQLVA